MLLMTLRVGKLPKGRADEQGVDQAIAHVQRIDIRRENLGVEILRLNHRAFQVWDGARYPLGKTPVFPDVHVVADVVLDLLDVLVDANFPPDKAK